jgi:tellurite resistance protein
METAIARLRAPEKWSGPLSEIVVNIPVSYFGIVLGLAGLGNAWRGAERTYQLPKFIEDWIYLIAGVVWALLVAIYLLKALLVPDKLLTAAHSGQSCFIGLAGAATMLVAGGLAPDARTSACVLFGIGFAFTLFLAVWRPVRLSLLTSGKGLDWWRWAKLREEEFVTENKIDGFPSIQGNGDGQPEQCTRRK